jgi:hypothetical protein
LIIYSRRHMLARPSIYDNDYSNKIQIIYNILDLLKETVFYLKLGFYQIRWSIWKKFWWRKRNSKNELSIRLYHPLAKFLKALCYPSVKITFRFSPTPKPIAPYSDKSYSNYLCKCLIYHRLIENLNYKSTIKIQIWYE